MKLLVIKILIASLILFQGCSKIAPQPVQENKKEFTIEVLYKTSGTTQKTISDIGAWIYIYYVPMNEIINKKYMGDGILQSLNNDTIISPDQIYKVANNEKIFISPLFSDRFITILVESNYYTNRLATLGYENFSKPIDAKVIFSP